MDQPRGHAVRRGFTLIELMVVIAVLLLLIGMLFLGLNQVAGTSKQGDTKAALQSAKAMFGEYEQATHFSRSMAGVGPSYSASVNFWTNPTAIQTPLNLQSSDTATQYALYNNLLAMSAILSMPNNLAIVQKLSSSKAKAMTLKSGNNTLTSQVLLDSWGNPIIFVPSGGLKGVTFSSAPPGHVFTVTSSSKQDTTSALYVPTGSERPFFVSAGPDGDVSKGDDNIYSFEQ